jgi:thiol-disulfide isomerase/thioredoxin
VSGRRATAALGMVLLLGACSAPAEEDDGAAPAAPPTSVAQLAACPQQPDQPAVGDQLLPALALDCPGGGSLDLGRAPGVPTVVNLWGSWCPPCRDEMPVLQQFSDTAGDAVRVVGVISKDGLPQAESFAADARVTIPSAFDGEGELMAELGLNQLPYTYFLDADGALVYTHLGPVGTLDELRGLVSEHLQVQV